jgi:hypothetical protein
MNATSLVEMIRENQPFQPLQFEFTGGAKEIVRHPDNIIVFGSYVIIAQFEDDSELPSRPKRYSLLHLVSVEPVHSQSA